MNHARDFLEGGNKVKFTFMYKGRERTHQDRAQKLLDQITQDLEDIAVPEAVNRVGPNLGGVILNKKR